MKIPFSNEYVGVGVEWTDALETEILGRINDVSCVELIPENFFSAKRNRFLDGLRKSNIPVLVHGVELSLGTAEPLRQDHLDKILEVADRVNTVNLSDHLAMTEAGGVEIGQLTPIPFTMEACDSVCRRIDAVQSQISVPFLIENITNRFQIPFCEMTETEFITRILKRTGCSLLLDLNNVYTNAFNFKYDPYAWLDEIPMEFVRGVHLAGGVYDDDGALVDSHSASVPPPVWDLFRYISSKVIPQCTIVEWTDDPPPYEVLLADVEQARRIQRAAEVTEGMVAR